MRINPDPPNSWKDLQDQVARILSECGLAAEVEKSIETARGSVNVDVLARDERATPATVCLCECKHWAASVSKAAVHAFRSVVADFGASWGFLISSAGFQSGAYEAAKFSNVRLMSWNEFEVEWMERWTERYLRPKLFEAHERLSDYTEPLLGAALTRRADELPAARRIRFIELRNDPSIVLPSALALQLGAPWHKLMGGANFDLPLMWRVPADAIKYAPSALVQTESLRQFGDILCDWIDETTKLFDDLFEGG